MKKKLRLIISGLGSKTKNSVIEETLKLFSLGHCTLTYHDSKCKIKNCPDLEWYKFSDLIYGNYPVNLASCIPIDDSLLRKLAFYETLTIQMMNRLDWDETISYNTRKEMYLRHVRFWNNQLINKKIDLCIFLGIPHEIFDFVLYAICKVRAIPIICLESGRHRDTTLIFQDYEQSMNELSERYNKLLNQSDTSKQVSFELSDKFRVKISDISYLKMSFIDVQKWRFRERIAYMVEIVRAVFSQPEKLVIRLFNPLFLLHRLKSILKKQTLKIYYSHLSKKPDFTKPYIYVALHYQPELTTSPLGGIFVNQELIVQMLDYILPKHIRIYVKEHPLPSYTMRSSSFYKSILISPRVTLIPIQTDSVEIIKHAIAVATSTGTVGWESLIRQKPVLMFGYEYYQYAPGVFRIDTIESCKQAVDKIINDKYIPSLKQLKIFYRAMQDTLIDGYIDEFYKPYTLLSERKNIENLSTALTQKIHKLIV